MVDIMLIIRATRLQKHGSCPQKTYNPMEDVTNKNLAYKYHLVNAPNRFKNRAFLGESMNNSLNFIILKISVLIFLIILVNIHVSVYKM